MLKILTTTRNILNSKLTFAKNATSCREFVQFNRIRTQQCVAPALVRNKSIATNSKQVKMIGWGVAGVVILGSMVFIDKSCVLLTVVPLFLFHHEKMLNILKMLPRDVVFLKRFAQAKIVSAKILSEDRTLHKMFKKRVVKHPNKVMMSMDGHDWKYNEMNSYANRVTRLVQRNKLSKGDVVCLMLENSPEMIGILIGLSQMGVIAALINFHLKTHGLKHCINISNCSMLIVDEAHVEVVEEIRPKLDKKIKFYQLEGKPKNAAYTSFQEEVFKEKTDPPEIIVVPKWDDPFVYIYTSGTSGVPKAAIIPHSKYLVNNMCGAIYLGLSPRTDKIYNPLPLYHATGLIVGAGPSITIGVPSYIKKRFSSRHYITDCNKLNCTVGMYVGEICRFIFLVPPNENDRKHNIRLMIGNGLNVDLWKKFLERFKVGKITEFYGQTEGNCNMINIDGKIGAVGFLPLIAPFAAYPYYLIKIDPETLIPLRDSKGMCIMCNYDEPGMLVGRIKKKVPEAQYFGYVNREEATKANILSDVFKKGDQAYVSGDVLVFDKFQYFYFKDRTGDSFRWKGENVSTTEVEGIVMGIVHKPSACFGVKLQAFDGLAGMVCIEDPSKSLDVNKILPELIHHLPKFAIPRFIRIVDKIEMTATHKIIKKGLAKEGINMDVIKDKVYYLDRKTSKYLPLTKQLKEDIESMKIELY